MPGRRRATWSSNEYFAHKKNVGEEVKLRNTLTTIEKHLGLNKDSMKHKVCEVRTSLKCIRKSTGHSIEALPPTPFQEHSESSNLISLQDKVPISRGGLPPEYQYLENEFDNQSNLINHDDLRLGDESEQIKPLYTHAMVDDPKNDGRYATRSPCMERDRISQRQHPDDQTNCNGEGRTYLPAINKQRDKVMPIIMIEDHVDENGEQTHIKKRHASPELKLPFLDNGSQITNSAVVNDNAPGYNNYEERNDKTSKTNYDSRNWISPIPSQPTSSDNLLREETRFTTTDNSEHSGKKNTLLPRRKTAQSKKQNKQTSLRDIRLRCRTCQERYRQNIEFQRSKKALEEREALQRQNEDKAMGGNLLFQNKPFLTSAAQDLESELTDEVLDFDDEDVPTKLNPLQLRKGPRTKKGYSRLRMEQLAQPRAARRRKILFSKHVIRKEADMLIESHSQPEMTDKEKERLRMLESKISMFLAMMQNSLIPSSMVDIPQREDIMRVDISHH